ncbi:MAG TPA: tail fiber protein [Thermoanaerobaculia bacterium]|jgi:microcystin-dependent protein|nr:tail fiber protein [Thermoanaerobaculia bacterium]
MALGEIRLFCGNFAPAGWRLCDGSSMSIAEHRALYDKIGTSYGGDGRTTFLLPDARGRAPMHRADGAALGTKGSITVEAEGSRNARHARQALNFIIGINHEPYPSEEPFLGEVRTFACNFAPEGWARCDGQLLPIRQNTALYSILDTRFGGDGTRTFAIPDLQEAYPVHATTPDGVGKTGAVWPAEEGSSQQTPLLVVTYVVAIRGLWPPR